jgi:phosphatidylserine/phosphatidylglycerophosphate/cardiolipin synthase-like enzyme
VIISICQLVMDTMANHRLYKNSSISLVAAFMIGACVCIMPCSQVYGFDVKNMELLQDQGYFPEVLRLINSAQNSVRVCMFQAVFYPRQTASPSNQLLQALIAAHNRGVSVEVILDNGGSLGEVAASNTQSAQLLKKAGVAVFFDSEHVTTHTKFLVIDNATAVFGSTNWTYSALAKNHELSAVVQSPEAARRMNDYFDMVRSGGKRF